MNFSKISFFAILFIGLISCSNDASRFETDTEVMDDEMQDIVDEADEEEPMEGDVSFSIVSAFPSIDFTQPLDLQVSNDNNSKIFVAEKRGVIRVFENDSTVALVETFLDLGNIASTSEQGLLGFAFHPEFESNGYFYVHYTPISDLAVVSRFSVLAENENIADTNSELVLLEIPQPQTNHNGGQIAFGSDGYLYVAVGDGGGGGDPDGNAQNRSNLLGNILRIDVDNTQGELNYAIPADNPFVADENIRAEIYAYGLRNPWRMSFDVQTDQLWVGDVGQNELEEIDVIENGGNYGWNLFEGTACFTGSCDQSNLIAPVFEYSRENGDRSITGGYVYRGQDSPSLFSKYIYADFASGRIWALSQDGSTNELLVETGLNISSFGTDQTNELFVLDFDGKIYKLIESE